MLYSSGGVRSPTCPVCPEEFVVTCSICLSGSPVKEIATFAFSIGSLPEGVSTLTCRFPSSTVSFCKYLIFCLDIKIPRIAFAYSICTKYKDVRRKLR